MKKLVKVISFVLLISSYHVTFSAAAAAGAGAQAQKASAPVKLFGLYEAVRRKSLNTCMEILQKHPVSLTEARSAFDFALYKLYLDRGVDWDYKPFPGYNTRMVEGDTALLQIVILLLERFGKDIFAGKSDNLFSAIGYNDVGMVNVLLAYGVPINNGLQGEYYVKHGGFASPLMRAADLGHLGIVKLLIAHGADLDIQDSKGATALMYAAQKGHAGVVQALLDAGASWGIKDKQGHTFFDYAQGKPEVMHVWFEYKKSRAKALEETLAEQHVPVKGVRKIIGDYI